jgi:RNA polymerase sigma-70 factor, ECF subfamily
MANSPQVSSRSDAELLGMALGGDETAFVVLYQRLKSGIFRYAFYITNSRSIAEDVTQEVFVVLLREGRKYRADRGDLAAFVFGIARNLARRAERRERSFEPIPCDSALEALSGHLMATSESPAGQILRKDLTAQVQAAVASLPDHYRQVVVLCDLCELSYEEAASRLKCALGTIRSRLNRAHALLAQKLKPLRSSQSSIVAAGSEGCIV